MSKAKLFSYDSRVKIFWSLVFVSVTMLGLYVYGVNSTVRNTALRENLETESANLATSLSEMEFRYIALKNDISLELAYERGYKDVEKPIFISRTKTLGLVTR